MRTYSELMTLPTFEERFRYLLLHGKMTEETFGWDRYMNQVFYTSKEWRRLRDEIIIRDDGCDLAHPDHPSRGRTLIHHMNPISSKDIQNRTEILMNPEFLITVSFDTHQAIHYGDESYLKRFEKFVPRSEGDTRLW